MADQLTSHKARAVNPACVVNVDVHNRRTPPSIRVEWTTGAVEEFDAGTNGPQIMAHLEQSAKDLQLEGLLKRCPSPAPPPPCAPPRAPHARGPAGNGGRRRRWTSCRQR